MALVFPNVGEDTVLNYLTNKDAPEDLVLHLYTSDTTPAEGDTLVTYTEASFTGYASIALANASWTVSAQNASYPLQTFSSTAGQTAVSVYGYYITRSVTGDLVYSERFTDGPYTIENNGDDIDVTLSIDAN